MDKLNSWRKTRDIEIDLADFSKALCMKWKQAFACAILFAVLLGAYGYVKEKRSMPLASPALFEETELSEEESRAVDAAVELQGEVSSLEEYLGNSVWMQVNPYRKNKTALLYSIEDAGRQDLQKIAESYLSFIENGGAAAALKQLNKGWDMDSSYLTELIAVSQKYSNLPYQVVVDGQVGEGLPWEAVFCIEVTGKDAKMAGDLASGMQEVLGKQYGVVKKNAGSHKLTLVSVEKGIVADSSLQSQQHEKRSLLQSYITNLKAMTGIFNDAQMEAYKKANGIGSEDVPSGEAAETQSARVNVKYILLGLFGGIFVYAGMFACQYLLRDTVKSEKQLKELYTFPVYGSVFLNKRKPLPFIRQESAPQSKAKLLERIRLACGRQGITKLCLASGIPLGAREKESLEAIGKQLKGWGIEIAIAENVGGDTAMWDDIARMGHVLLVCKAGETAHHMIDEEMEFYLENKIEVLGAMAIIS